MWSLPIDWLLEAWNYPCLTGFPKCSYVRELAKIIHLPQYPLHWSWLTTPICQCLSFIYSHLFLSIVELEIKPRTMSNDRQMLYHWAPPSAWCCVSGRCLPRSHCIWQCGLCKDHAHPRFSVGCPHVALYFHPLCTSFSLPVDAVLAGFSLSQTRTVQSMFTRWLWPGKPWVCQCVTLNPEAQKLKPWLSSGILDSPWVYFMDMLWRKKLSSDFLTTPL